ncbi:malignant T-cell-amplified sequence 1-like [Tropilaelaps mercedesae]|uniref:Malignant T-cell-amplified sequence 1-like n=1 Tax=Tropilaelaps mercedesae TaxID=418985 RepID=A0A1V9XLH0_9ACAR|nr:malignant T-cell-amplified sequence 1-like [Tropilaelaps mercedesae]
MFKKFTDKENVSGVVQLKSSVQKGIRTKICEQFPLLTEQVRDEVLPKKDQLRIVKCHEHVEILVNGQGEPLFFRQREGPYFPALRLLHKYPFICPWLQASDSLSYIQHVETKTEQKDHKRLGRNEELSRELAELTETGY